MPSVAPNGSTSPIDVLRNKLAGIQKASSTFNVNNFVKYIIEERYGIIDRNVPAHAFVKSFADEKARKQFVARLSKLKQSQSFGHPIGAPG